MAAEFFFTCFGNPKTINTWGGGMWITKCAVFYCVYDLFVLQSNESEVLIHCFCGLFTCISKIPKLVKNNVGLWRHSMCMYVWAWLLLVCFLQTQGMGGGKNQKTKSSVWFQGLFISNFAHTHIHTHTHWRKRKSIPPSCPRGCWITYGTHQTSYQERVHSAMPPSTSPQLF